MDSQYRSYVKSIKETAYNTQENESFGQRYTEKQQEKKHQFEARPKSSNLGNKSGNLRNQNNLTYAHSQE